MTVAVDTSTNGGFKMFTSTNGAVAICLADVLDEMEKHHCPDHKIKFVTWFDDTSQEFTLTAIVGS